MQIIKKKHTINSRKFDCTIHKSWKAELIIANNSLLKFQGKFENEINHEHLGIIRHGTFSIEYFWLDKWFNVFQFLEPDGTFRNFYCNISMPPTFQNDVLEFIDLDMDVVVWRNFNYEILDVEEFKENSVKYNYSDIVINKALDGLQELLEMIAAKKFPFNI